MTHGAFAWNELLARDVEKAKAFYAASLGWSYDKMTMPKGGDYWVATIGGKAVAGLVEMEVVVPGMPAHVPSHWFPYIEVDDVDARVRTWVAAGGQLMRDLFDVPDVGRLAIVTDAVGSGLGLMTSVKR